MITVGPAQIEAMPFGDWVALLRYAETTSYVPVVLAALMTQDPRTVDPEDLADELDHLWDTNPPEPVQAILVGVLQRLQDAGVRLARLEP